MTNQPVPSGTTGKHKEKEMVAKKTAAKKAAPKKTVAKPRITKAHQDDVDVLIRHMYEVAVREGFCGQFYTEVDEAKKKLIAPVNSSMEASICGSVTVNVTLNFDSAPGEFKDRGWQKGYALTDKSQDMLDKAFSDAFDTVLYQKDSVFKTWKPTQFEMDIQDDEYWETS